MANTKIRGNFAIFAGDELIEDNLATYALAKIAVDDYAVNLLKKNRIYGKLNIRNKYGVKLFETNYIDVKEGE